MSPVREQFLTLLEVEEVIRKFEEKYKVSTTEFLMNSEMRSTMLDDDVFQWEAFNAHKDEIQRTADELRSVYLQKLVKTTDGPCAANNNLALAA